MVMFGALLFPNLGGKRTVRIFHIYGAILVSDSLPDAAIQQLNLGYDAQQDRLLLKIGLADDTEIRMWLTRRTVKALWAVLQGSSVTPVVMPDIFTAETQEMLADFARETRDGEKSTTQKTVQKMDFSDTYQPNRKTRTSEPMLAIDCQVTNLDNAKSSLELHTQDGNAVHIPLTQELAQALGNMLQLATREAVWDISLSSSQIIVSSSTTQPVLH
jgi:hypothetical protein